MSQKESNELNSETSIKNIISDNPLHMIINIEELLSDEKNPKQKKEDKKKGKQEGKKEKKREIKNKPGEKKIIAVNKKNKKNEKKENNNKKKEEFKNEKEQGKNKLENIEKDKGENKMEIKDEDKLEKKGVNIELDKNLLKEPFFKKYNINSQKENKGKYIYINK